MQLQKLNKGQSIKLQSNSKLVLKFSKIKNLAVYIKSNQQDTETTYINGLEIIGDIINTVNDV